MKVAILYGSTTGKTEAVARRIHALLPGSVLFSVARTTAADLQAFGVILIGTSKWGTGTLADSWSRRLADFPVGIFSGKTLAFFGLGDRVAFGKTFCAAVTTLRDRFSPGSVVLDPALLIDDDNQADLTEALVIDWVGQIKDHAFGNR